MYAYKNYKACCSSLPEPVVEEPVPVLDSPPVVVNATPYIEEATKTNKDPQLSFF